MEMDKQGPQGSLGRAALVYLLLVSALVLLGTMLYGLWGTELGLPGIALVHLASRWKCRWWVM